MPELQVTKQTSWEVPPDAAMLIDRRPTSETTEAILNRNSCSEQQQSPPEVAWMGIYTQGEFAGVGISAGDEGVGEYGARGSKVEWEAGGRREDLVGPHGSADPGSAWVRTIDPSSRRYYWANPVRPQSLLHSLQPNEVICIYLSHPRIHPSIQVHSFLRYFPSLPSPFSSYLHLHWNKRCWKDG